jgi:hypothetical protein
MQTISSKFASLVCIVMFALGCSGIAQALSPSEREEAMRVAREVHKDGRYPKDLQTTSVKKPITQGDEQRECSGCADCKACDTAIYNTLHLSAGCAQVAPWLLLFVAIFLVAMWLWQYLPRHRAEAKLPQQIESIPSVMGLQLPLNIDPNELFAKGEYMAAIVALLLRALQMLGWKPDGAGRSQTPREVIAEFARSDRRVGHLRLLLQIAERVRFGGELASAAVYQDAHRIYQQLKREVGSG